MTLPQLGPQRKVQNRARNALDLNTGQGFHSEVCYDNLYPSTAEFLLDVLRGHRVTLASLRTGHISCS